MNRAVTVIIPTLGRAERAQCLTTAIESAISQRNVVTRVIVVLNGNRVDPEVERRLRTDPAIRLIRLEPGDLPKALRTGREAVDTPYFTALDDDDLLLPGALERRVRELEDHPECAVVVTNGYCRAHGHDEILITIDQRINEDPLHALLDRNWLLPGSWLCRTDAVDATLFDDMPRFLECTYLGMRFATEYAMRWIGEPTVVYNLGSPEAESRSRAYVVGQAAALRGLLSLDLPDSARARLRRRIADAYHAASGRERAGGGLAAAWRWHLASLISPGGWRYLPYTRHLLLRSKGTSDA